MIYHRLVFSSGFFFVPLAFGVAPSREVTFRARADSKIVDFQIEDKENRCVLTLRSQSDFDSKLFETVETKIGDSIDPCVDTYPNPDDTPLTATNQVHGRGSLTQVLKVGFEDAPDKEPNLRNVICSLKAAKYEDGVPRKTAIKEWENFYGVYKYRYNLLSQRENAPKDDRFNPGRPSFTMRKLRKKLCINISHKWSKLQEILNAAARGRNPSKSLSSAGTRSVGEIRDEPIESSYPVKSTTFEYSDTYVEVEYALPQETKEYRWGINIAEKSGTAGDVVEGYDSKEFDTTHFDYILNIGQKGVCKFAIPFQEWEGIVAVLSDLEEPIISYIHRNMKEPCLSEVEIESCHEDQTPESSSLEAFIFNIRDRGIIGTKYFPLGSRPITSSSNIGCIVDLLKSKIDKLFGVLGIPLTLTGKSEWIGMLRSGELNDKIAEFREAFDQETEEIKQKKSRSGKGMVESPTPLFTTQSALSKVGRGMKSNKAGNSLRFARHDCEIIFNDKIIIPKECPVVLPPTTCDSLTETSREIIFNAETDKFELTCSFEHPAKTHSPRSTFKYTWPASAHKLPLINQSCLCRSIAEEYVNPSILAP